MSLTHLANRPAERRGPVLLVSNCAWNLAHFRRPIIEALVAAGEDVLAAAAPDGSEHGLVALGARFHPLPVDAGGTSVVADLKLLAAIRQLVRRERPRALLSFTVKPNVYGPIAARMAGVPAIATISGLGSSFLGGGPTSRIVERLYRFALSSADRVFFQNGEDRDLFVRRSLVRDGQCALVPGSGIDLAAFRPPEREPGMPLRFLFIGRMLRDKGLVELAEAALLNRAAGLDVRVGLLGGDGGDNPSAVPQGELARWEADGLVECLGRTEDVRPHIAAAHCVVLPSYREGLPRSLLEGAAMARPLIATDVTGCRDLVEDGVNGLLCAPRSASDLARAMRQMAELPIDRRAAMGRAGRRLVEQRFDQRIVADAYLQALAR